MTQQTRAERRAATEARILECARAQFAAAGFERTTIRAVASAAGVDPALVMHYFGSKRALFERAVTQAPTPGQEAPADGSVAEQLLTSLAVKLRGLPPGALATIRSMLTDPVAGEQVRTGLAAQARALSGAMPEADDAELRAALLVSAMIGITLGQQVLDVPALRDAPVERITDLLRPAFETLTGEEI